MERHKSILKPGRVAGRTFSFYCPFLLFLVHNRGRTFQRAYQGCSQDPEGLGGLNIKFSMEERYLVLVSDPETCAGGCLPMVDRSKGRNQMKTDPLALQVGGVEY